MTDQNQVKNSNKRPSGLANNSSRILWALPRHTNESRPTVRNPNPLILKMTIYQFCLNQNQKSHLFTGKPRVSEVSWSARHNAAYFRAFQALQPQFKWQHEAREPNPANFNKFHKNHNPKHQPPQSLRLTWASKKRLSRFLKTAAFSTTISFPPKPWWQRKSHKITTTSRRWTIVLVRWKYVHFFVIKRWVWICQSRGK